MERAREREGERGTRSATWKTGVADGGWIPVIRNHKKASTAIVGDKDFVTLFVDNIPEYKDQLWLQRTFNKFGVVKDAFIPRKRSKRTGNKFGFVRYDCRVSANVAISRMNGVWVDNDRLFVKEACFGYYDDNPKVKLPRFQGGKEKVVKEKEILIHKFGSGELMEKGNSEIQTGGGTEYQTSAKSCWEWMAVQECDSSHA